MSQGSNVAVSVALETAKERDEEPMDNDEVNSPSTSSAFANGQVSPEDSNSPSRNEEIIPDLSLISLPLSKVALDKVDFVRDAHNRVKLYVLCDQRVWDDRGTGHVTCIPTPDDPNSWCLIVRLEANEKNVLESRILPDTIYQKQQGTLIVWSESETCDLALSFQEKAGCTDIWDKICRIQGKDPNAEDDAECDDQEPSDSSTSGISSNICTANVSLPPCNLQHLTEIELTLSQNMLLTTQRERMATVLQQNSYVAKLCDLFQMCEDLENMEALQTLYSIAKNMFLLNSNAMLNDLLEKKYFKDVVGMLEYDPSFPEPKKHREFLWERSKFREILPIKSEELKAKIHQTYRVQYVLDVCLPAPSLFEENLLTVLSSHLFFNRAEIVNALLNDKELMKQLFDELKDSSISPKRQRDLTNFLKEFCSFAHSLQSTGPQGREQFFKALMSNDVMATIDPCISSPLSSTRAATVELLTMIVDFNPQLFRDYLVKQFRIIPESRNDDLLINKLINHMLSDKDPEQTAANQMSQALRILLDPESIVAKGEKSEFLPIFYKRAMYSLCKPIIANAISDAPVRDDYYTANRLALVIDLFCFFVDHHSYNMRSYIVHKNLLHSVLVYLKSRHHFLALSALRMCRRILNLKDELYFHHIRDRKILDQIVECFKQNGDRYNLLNSAIIEFFEFIRSDEIRSLMIHVMENYWDVFKDVTYVRTFSGIQNRCDQFDASVKSGAMSKVSEKDEDDRQSVTSSPTNAQWRKERDYDNDELFFNKDDDENWTNKPENGRSDEGLDFDNDDVPQRKSGVEPFFPSLSRKRKANDDDGVASIFGGNITPPVASTQSRLSKIVICMSNGGNTASDKTVGQRPVSSDVVDPGRKEGGNGNGESVVSSSSSPPKQSAVFPTSTTCSPCSAKEGGSDVFDDGGSSSISPNASSAAKSPLNPIILKKGLSGLVDYDESDDDSDEDEGAAESKTNESRSSNPPNDVCNGDGGVEESDSGSGAKKSGTDLTPVSEEVSSY